MEEERPKKRKRQSNGVDVPSKKVAFDGAGLIKVAFGEEHGLAPVVISSPGLTNPDVAFKAYSKRLASRNTDNGSPRPSTHDLLLHSQEHTRLDYTASSLAADASLSHYVAVYDPATKQLQVTPSHHLSLRSTLRSEIAPEERKRRTILQQRQELGQEFGTKKAKKIIAEKTVNAIINRDPKGKSRKDDVQDAILQSMPDVAANAPSEQQELEASLASKPIPRPNLDVKDIEDVYPFDTLVPPADAKLLDVKEWMEKTKKEQPITFYHRFPAHRVEALGKTDQILRLKALKYLSLLLEFKDALRAAGRAGMKVPKKDKFPANLLAWPDALVSSVRRRFASEANDLNQWRMQNLYTHICALTLYVDGWVTATADVKEDLKMETKEIVSYFRELGCKVTAPTEGDRERFAIKKGMERSVKVAKLKMPLDFPKARAGRRR